MTVLLTLLGLVGVGTALAGAGVVRALRRLDHRCVVCADPSCLRCAGVARDEDRGGHMVCACGAMSSHLFGADLLAWRAEHYGETLPPFPADAEPVAQVGEEPAAEARDGIGSEPARRTTRARSAAQEEERIRQRLTDELDETQRRMIHRARRRPDPITPQLLREAGQLGVRPEPQPPSTRDSAQPAPATGEPTAPPPSP